MEDVWKAYMYHLPCRILNESWWSAELPTEEELQEGRDNLEKVDYKVDYVITHCASNRIQKCLEEYKSVKGVYGQDILTDYFEELEDRLQYKRWYFGHYHDDFAVDERHSLMYRNIVPIGHPSFIRFGVSQGRKINGQE